MLFGRHRTACGYADWVRASNEYTALALSLRRMGEFWVANSQWHNNTHMQDARELFWRMVTCY